MADEATPITETPKKASKGPAKAKKAKPAASHPKVSVMVNAAIKQLKERGGSSLQAIKKYIASNYKVDVERLAPFIKKYLKTAVATGELVQTKGKGASGSFKLKASGVGKAEGKPKATKKPVKKAKLAASTPKKAAKPAKKASVKKVTKKPKAEKKSKPAKSPKKPKAKPVAKPKPKPKKAKAAPKKAAPKKGKK